MLINSVQNNLNEIISLLNQLSEEQYCEHHLELSNASIGQHTRHIIELFQCLTESYNDEVVNYDLRKRNTTIEISISYAIKAIEELILNINHPNKNMKVEQGINTVQLSIETNYFRELLYNLEHSIHHQALIKVALLKFPHVRINENFGVAKSTIEYRSQCAQ